MGCFFSNGYAIFDEDITKEWDVIDKEAMQLVPQNKKGCSNENDDDKKIDECYAKNSTAFPDIEEAILVYR